MAAKKKTKTILSENIRLLRESLGLRQTEFALLTKVTQANVSQWESGASIAPIKVIQIIKEKYPKVNVESFFTKPEPNKNFQIDSRDIGLKGLKEENEDLKKVITAHEKTIKELREDINRLREQNEVLNMVVREKLKK